MTDPTAIDLLSDAEAYLSALHVHVARHDNIGADLTCGGCKLRDRVAAALPQLAAVPPANQTTDRAAVLREAADWFDSGSRSVSQMFGHQVAAELLRLAAEAPTTTQPEESGAALARYIADQPVSTIQSAFRVLGWPPLRFELVDDEPAAGARQDGAQPQEADRG